MAMPEGLINSLFVVHDPSTFGDVRRPVLTEFALKLATYRLLPATATPVG